MYPCFPLENGSLTTQCRNIVFLKLSLASIIEPTGTGDPNENSQMQHAFVIGKKDYLNFQSSIYSRESFQWKAPTIRGAHFSISLDFVLRGGGGCTLAINNNNNNNNN